VDDEFVLPCPVNKFAGWENAPAGFPKLCPAMATIPARHVVGLVLLNMAIIMTARPYMTFISELPFWDSRVCVSE
jgi:hypothetical protein